MHVGTRLIACLERLAVPMLCLLDLAELRAGHSGDAVWDALQLFLVQNGELHNNARMGWGKAILKWTAGPAECMETLMDLNNRFALDGHSPPSMAGLLGCMGLFETPRGERSRAERPARGGRSRESKGSAGGGAVARRTRPRRATSQRMKRQERERRERDDREVA